MSARDPSLVPEPAPVARDLARTTLAVLLIVGLIAASLWILRPFMAAIIWATMIVVSSWPLMLRVQGWLWSRRALAVAAMTIVLLLLLVVPLTLAVTTIVSHADALIAWAAGLGAQGLPALPEAVRGLPFVGARLAATWDQLRAAGAEGALEKLTPYLRTALVWFASQVGGLGAMVLQFLLTVVVSAILYARGEVAAAGLLRFTRRLAGRQGEAVVYLAGQAVRSVALGIVVTALVQSLAGGIGLALTGVPLAAVLTAVMFLLSIAQLGPLLVLVPAVVWLYWSGQTGWGTFLLVWTVLVGSLDNVLRPVLIRRGADLPLLLIIAGVIGGLIAFGLVGLFVGPVILAVAYTLLQAWVREEA